MTWDGTDFLVSIKLRLDGRICNALIIFNTPPSPSMFSPSGDVAVEVAFLCSSSASSPPRLLILIPMLFILLLFRVLNREAAPDLIPQLPWLLRWAEIDPDNIWIFIKDMDLTSSTLRVGMPPMVSSMSSTPRDNISVGIPRAFPSTYPSPFPSLPLLSPFYFLQLSRGTESGGQNHPPLCLDTPIL